MWFQELLYKVHMGQYVSTCKENGRYEIFMQIYTTKFACCVSCILASIGKWIHLLILLMYLHGAHKNET